MEEVKYIEEYKWLLELIDNDPSPLIEVYLESGRGAGKNAQIIETFFYWLADNDKKFNLTIFRKQSQNIREIWNDFGEYALYDYTINNKFKELTINDNKVTFNSLFTSSGQPVGNLGKSMAQGADYMVIWEDESTDITDEDRNKIEQAYARFGKKMIIIRSWNPWTPYNPIVKFMAKYMPYPGVPYMKEHHQQLVKEEDNGVSYYFFRTSMYINPYASPPHVKALEKQAALDEDEGNTILWAKPGIVDGAIYKDLNKCLVESEGELRLKRIIAGIDFGTTDATSVSLIGISSDNNDRAHGFHVLDEYYHQNKKGEVRKTLDDYVVEVVEYLVDKYNEYNLQNSESQVLNCYVDYARQASQDVAFVEMLTQYAKENKIWQIRFHKAQKKPIRDRITLEKYLMATSRFTINKTKAPNHVREFSNSFYDTSRLSADGFHPRMDADNHAIDSCEYGLAEVATSLHKPDYMS